MAASINEGKVTPQSTYEDRGYLKIEGWPKPIKNSDYESYGGHGVVDMTSVLENSLNTGAIFAMQRAGAETFARYVADFGFGEKTGVELEAESSGNIESLKRKTIRPVEAATASFGQGITVTPLQLAAAFAVIANGGILMKPYLVGEIVNPDGSKVRTQPQQIRRVISERTALLVAGMMVKVIEHGHAKRAAVKGYYVAGKTGTAQVADKVRAGYSDQTIHTFVGFAPVDDPKIVMVVRLDNPKDVRFADSSAAPLFGELAEFILNYYQVPKER
jgi:cell division protein FtsI/penicillin-binding protein 2